MRRMAARIALSFMGRLGERANKDIFAILSNGVPTGIFLLARYVSIRSNDIDKEEERKIKRDLLALRAIIGRYNRWMY